MQPNSRKLSWGLGETETKKSEASLQLQLLKA